MIALPTIYHRSGVYLIRGEPTAHLRRADRAISVADREGYRARVLEANGHLAEGDGVEAYGIVVMTSIHLDSSVPPDRCSEVGTIPIAPRPEMWLGSFPLQTLPRTP